MVINTLTQLKRNALKAMNPVKKVSIYWILFLQSRHFLSGETTKLAEYKVMVDNLIAKQANIAHTELPDALIPGHKRKRETDQEEEKKEDSTAEYGETPQKVVPTVNFLKLAHFCNTNSQVLGLKNRCIPGIE
eukprot:8043895-Ditylum_brightwellii.AAC.1